MTLVAGEEAAIQISCNMHGCNNWNSGYNLFELQSSVSADLVTYSPTASSLSMIMRGTPYSFTPQSFTAGTINVGVLNATTINGAISGTNVNSGTISAAYLPVFGPSGSTHAPGIVPDPGAVAGSTRFLREDGTWVVPSGGSSSGVQIGGDIGGTLASPKVTGIQGNPVSATAPTVGQVYVWNGTAFVPATRASTITLEHVFTGAGTFNYTHNLGTLYPLMTCYVNSGSASYTASNPDANDIAITVPAASDITCTFGI